MPTILKAQPVADSVYSRITRAVDFIKAKGKKTPTLATVLVGEDPASQVYVRSKGKMCEKLGLGHKDFKLAATTSQADLIHLIEKLNADDQIDGILVQKPLPKQIDEARIFELIDPAKDVDCFSPHNVGLLVQGRGKLLPCTPAGIMEILQHYKISPAGKNALVLGRSEIVGKPIGLLLLNAHATVTYTHSKTANLDEHLAQADLVVAAIGRAHFLDGKRPWKKTCAVIDVGINRIASKAGERPTIVGDVDYEAVSPKVAAITPVPGGVGPMTIAMLMQNTVRAALMRRGLPEVDSGL